MNRTGRAPLKRLSLFLFLACACVATSALAQRRTQVRVPAEIARNVLSDSDNRECVSKNGGIEKAVQVEPIRLGRGARPELLVRGTYPCFCGAQNCAYWVYREGERGYELLLTIDSAVTVRANNTFTNGYRDITSESHSSAFETYISTYKFDGREYQSKGCVVRSYMGPNGRQLKRPVYRKC